MSTPILAGSATGRPNLVCSTSISTLVTGPSTVGRGISCGVLGTFILKVTHCEERERHVILLHNLNV